MSDLFNRLLNWPRKLRDQPTIIFLHQVKIIVIQDLLEMRFDRLLNGPLGDFQVGLAVGILTIQEAR